MTNSQATQAQIGAYLVALRMKGRDHYITEIKGSVRAMRENAFESPTSTREEPVYDIVGYGR